VFCRGSFIRVDPCLSVAPVLVLIRVFPWFSFSVFPWSRHEFQPGYVGEVARIQCPASRLLDNRAGPRANRNVDASHHRRTRNLRHGLTRLRHWNTDERAPFRSDPRLTTTRSIRVDPCFSVALLSVLIRAFRGLFSVFPWSRHEFQPGYVGEVARIQCPEGRLLDNRAGPRANRNVDVSHHRRTRNLRHG
jgi:hypothetical protein